MLAANLRWKGCVQPTLFEAPAEQAEAVASVKRAVNERFGRFTLRSGATLYLEEVYGDAAQNFDICDVHGKICF